MSLSLFVHGTKMLSIIHETMIRLIGMDTTILGEIFQPFVSSSKNLNNPALDAGNGAPFFLSPMVIFTSQKLNIKTLFIIENYVVNHSFLGMVLV